MTDDSRPTEWISTKEAVELTGYHPVHVRGLLREGRIEGREFGRDWMTEVRGSPDRQTPRRPVWVSAPGPGTL